ncbi:MAG: hypothetical protein QXW42_04140 [Thermofilum sp.]
MSEGSIFSLPNTPEEKPPERENFLKRFLKLSLRKKLFIILMALSLAGIGYAGATIISNIISGTTTVTGLTVTVLSPPLLPTQTSLETDYTNTLRVINPLGASVSGSFYLNFTTNNPPLHATDFEVYIDIDGDGFETTEKLACTLDGNNKASCATPVVTIPVGTKDYPIKVKFKSTLPIPANLDYALYIAT